MSEHKLSQTTTERNQIFCDRLKKHIVESSLEEAILEFRCLFTEGISQNTLIKNLIEDITYERINKEDFQKIINYYCCLSIDKILQSKEDSQYILQLVQIFEDIDLNTKYYIRKKQKIALLTEEFKTSKSYAKLKRIAVVFTANHSDEINNSLSIQSLLPRYTYLYQYLIIDRENIDELNQLIKELAETKIRAFELKLSQHIIYRSRLIEIAKAQQFSHGAGRIIRRIANPTLLSDRDLKTILKQNLKKIDRKVTLERLARDFTLKIKREITYREFKQYLSNYLLYKIEPRNSQFKFKEKLWEILDSTYYQSDSLFLTENLLFITCRKLYQTLIINNAEKNEPEFLIQLINNLGTAQTVMLFTKIVLICPQAKPDLEQRLANLFIYYESNTVENTIWLIKLLEYFLITFTIHFEKIDLSLAKSM